MMSSTTAKVALTVLTGSLIVDAKSFLADSPVEYSDFIRSAFPLGNGRLGGWYFAIAIAETIDKCSYMNKLQQCLSAPTGKTSVNLNIDTLWSGGPFENPV